MLKTKKLQTQVLRFWVADARQVLVKCKPCIHNCKNWFKKHFCKKDTLFLFLFLSLTLSFFKLNYFPDEHEHAVAGWLMGHGLLPYVNFFSHHGPMMLYLSLSALLLPFVDGVLLLRFWMLVYQLAILILVLISTNKQFRPVVYLSILLIALAYPTFAWQMFLTDTLISFNVFALLVWFLHYALYRQPSLKKLALVYGLSSVLCLWSSPASVVVFVALGLILLYLIYWQKAWQDLKFCAKTALLTLALHLIFPIFYFLNGGFKQFIWQVFAYNSQYYYPLRLASNQKELEWGYFYQLISQFYLMIGNNLTLFFDKSLIFAQSLVGLFSSLIKQAVDNPSDHLEVIIREYSRIFESSTMILTLTIVFVWLYLLIKRQILMAIFFALLAIATFFRSNEVFHLGPLFMLSTVGLVYVVVSNCKKFSLCQQSANCSCQQSPSQAVATIASLLLIAVNIYHFYLPYKQNIGQQAPYIKPEIKQFAQQIQQLTNDEDKILVVDIDMIYYYLSNRLPACFYHFYLPWLHQTPIIRQRYEACLTEQLAKLLIIPEPDAFPASDLQNIIEENYLPLTLIDKQSASKQIFVRK